MKVESAASGRTDDTDLPPSAGVVQHARLGGIIALVVTACAVAGLAAGDALLLSHAARERGEIEGRALVLARTIAYAADREVAAAVGRLEALSSSPALRTGDLEALRLQLATTPTPDGSWFALRAAEGQLLNTLQPNAVAPALPRDRDLRRPGMLHFEELILRGRPAVSPLVWGPLAGTYVIAVSLPTALSDERRPVLLQTQLSRERLAKAIFEQSVSPGWSAWLIDRAGKTIVHAPAAGAPSGPEAPLVWSGRLGEPNLDGAGEFVAPDQSGNPMLVTFVKGQAANWTVAVGVPLALAERPMRQALLTVCGSAAALLALAGAATFWLRDRIGRVLTALQLALSEAWQRERSAEARFRHFWEHVSEGLFVVQVTSEGDFLFKDLKPAHARATGLTTAAIAEKRLEEFLPTEVAAMARLRYRNCVERGSAVHYAEILDLPDGRREWETSLTPMRDPRTGRVLALFGTVRDVTEHRRAERAVRLNEERLRLAQRAAGAGVWEWDLLSGAMNWSPEMYLLIGVTPIASAPAPDDLRAAWLAHVHPDDRPRIEQSLRAAADGEGRFDAECRVVRGGSASGELRWLATRGQMIVSDAGLERRMLGVTVDVTERRRAEIAARDSLALLQAGLDALTAQVAILDGAGKVVAVNAAWCRGPSERGEAVSLGPGADYPAACEALGKTSPEWMRIAEGLRAVLVGEVEDLRGEHRGMGGVAERDRWFQIRATRFGHGDGRRLIVAHEDISEVRRSAEALNTTTDRLLTLQDEEQRRIARELHDTTVQDLAMAIIGIDLAAAARARETCTPALAEVRALLERAVRDVRTLSYLLHPPLLEECGLAIAVATYAEGFARRSGVDVGFAMDDAPPEAIPSAIAVALFRIAQEAFTNAHRHGGARRMRVRLQVAAGDRVELCVEDDGHGFPMPVDAGAADKGRPNERCSLGVGVPGMRARVRQLGGTLRIETGPAGTQVTATVPLRASDAHGSEAPPRPLQRADARVRSTDAGGDIGGMSLHTVGGKRAAGGEVGAPGRAASGGGKANA